MLYVYADSKFKTDLNQRVQQSEHIATEPLIINYEPKKKLIKLFALSLNRPVKSLCHHVKTTLLKAENV